MLSAPKNCAKKFPRNISVRWTVISTIPTYSLPVFLELYFFQELNVLSFGSITCSSDHTKTLQFTLTQEYGNKSDELYPLRSTTNSSGIGKINNF